MYWQIPLFLKRNSPGPPLLTHFQAFCLQLMIAGKWCAFVMTLVSKPTTVQAFQTHFPLNCVYNLNVVRAKTTYIQIRSISPILLCTPLSCQQSMCCCYSSLDWIPGASHNYPGMISLTAILIRLKHVHCGIMIQSMTMSSVPLQNVIFCWGTWKIRKRPTNVSCCVVVLHHVPSHHTK